jgi:hypothetical protein
LEDPVAISYGAAPLRSTIAVGVRIIVMLVILGVTAAVGWWLLTAIVNPLPYSDPEALTAAWYR